MLPWIDTHLHVWDQSQLEYPWMATAHELPKLATLPEASEALHAAAIGFILIEAGARDPAAELGYLETVSLGRPVKGVVGALNWRRPDQLSSLTKHPSLVGVRLNLLDTTDRKSADVAVLASTLTAVGAAGLAVDVLCDMRGLEFLRASLQRSENGEIVINHLGRPPVGAGIASADASTWLRAIAALALLPRVNLKLSGLASEHSSERLWGPFLNAALLEFDTPAVIIGSDWPVSRTRSDPAYGAWSAIAVEYVGSDFSEAARLSNASRIYGLPML